MSDEIKQADITPAEEAVIEPAVEPIKEEVEINQNALGGMYCIRTDIQKIKVNGKPQITKSA